jgi:hypothetical protein
MRANGIAMSHDRPDSGVTMRSEWAMMVALSLAPAAFGQIGNIPGTGYTGVPYSAVETKVTSLRTMTALISRDTLGRTRQEYITRQQDGSELHSVRIMDPTTGLVLLWAIGNDVQDRVVTVEQLPVRQRHTGPIPQDREAPSPGTKPCGIGCNLENLPAQVVNGYLCRGFRVKQLVRDPATKSNSIRTTENWTSPELGVIMRHMEIDVIAGRITSEINNVSRGEPDPTLFQTPQGYRVDMGSALGQTGR